MKRLEMVRQALLEMGDVPSQDLAAFIEKRYGVKIEPNYIPVYKASIRDLEKLTRFRQSARMEKAA